MWQDQIPTGGTSVIIPGNKNKIVQAFELCAQFQDKLFTQGQTQIINRAVIASGARLVALINLHPERRRAQVSSKQNEGSFEVWDGEEGKEESNTQWLHSAGSLDTHTAEL